MRKVSLQFLTKAKVLLALMFLLVTSVAFSQTCEVSLRNDSLIDANNLIVDIYVKATSGDFYLSNSQFRINYTSAIKGTGTLSGTIVPGYSDLSNASQVPITVTFFSAYFRVFGGSLPASQTAGSVISSTGIGTRICRVKLNNTVAFPALQMNNLVSQTNPSKTIVMYAGVGNTSNQIPDANCIMKNTYQVNPTLNGPITATSVTGTGSYCSGQSGVAVGLAGSQTGGVNYQLYNGATAVGSAVNGTGSALSFGNQSAGTYSVKGHRQATYMYADMTGTAVVTMTALPVAAGSINGSAAPTQGNTGVAYSVAAITGATSYVWSYTGTGATIIGSGNSVTIDFAMDATSGTLKVKGHNSCGDGVESTKNLNVQLGVTAPVAFAVLGGGSYCQGTGGLEVGLAGSETGVTYTLYKGGVAQVPTVAGTGSAISFGNQLAGTYTVSGNNIAGTTPMTGSAVITENPTVTASVSIEVDQNNVCAGTSVTFTATPIGGGSNPAFTWYKNGTVVGSGLTYSVSPANGDQVYVAMASNAICPSTSAANSNSITMVIAPVVAAGVSIDASQNNVCAGTTVTFTASPVGGGATPTYAWYKNGSSVGTGATYAYVPANGDVVYVVMTTSSACATGSPATSNSITMVVNPISTSSVSIVLDQNNVCPGTQVTFTATPVNGGVSPSYQWYKNNVLVPGVTGATYSFVPNSGLSIVYAVLSSSVACAAQSTSNSINLHVYPGVYTSVNLTASASTVCSSNPVTFTANTIGGGATPVYKWYKNSALVVGNTTATYTFAPANGDQVYVQMLSSATCPTSSTVTSSTITMVVTTAATASVSLVASQNPSCQGSNVQFVASPVNGGTSPAYQWYKNGNPIAAATAYSNSLVTVPVNGDVFKVQMTSSLACTSPALSNEITMGVGAPVTPSVTIAASANPVVVGTSANITATAVNGGTPTYKWYVNSVLQAGATASTFSFVPNNGDYVQVKITSSLSCVTTLTANSNYVYIQVVPAATTWTGNVDNNWFNAGNWSAGVPGSITVVSIPSGRTNYPTLLAQTNIASFTMEDGASFIGSEFLSVANNAITIKRNIADNKVHYLSSPVAFTTFGTAFAGHITSTFVKEYNTATGAWVTKTAANAFAVGKGYNVYTTTPTLVSTFTGAMNKTAVANTLLSANGGWNLLGNPFQSAIDWDLLNKGTGVGDVVYVYDGTIGNYRTWSTSLLNGSLTNGIIPAENGFFATTTTNNAILNVPFTARVHSLTSFVKSSPSNTLKLEAIGGQGSDEMLVHFNDEATSMYDNQFDGKKFWGSEDAPQLYSVMSDEVLSLNQLPMAGNETVNVGFKCSNTGEYTINAKGVESFDASTPVLLEDLKTKTVQDLRSNPVYRFDYVAGENANRFRLIFKTGSSDVANTGITVYSTANTVVVNNLTGQAGEVWVYDMAGRELTHTTMGSQMRTSIPMQVSTGTYMVKVVTSKASVNQKVFLR